MLKNTTSNNLKLVLLNILSKLLKSKLINNKSNNNKINNLINNNKLQLFNNNYSNLNHIYNFNNNKLLNNLFLDFNLNSFFNTLFYQNNSNINKKLNINISNLIFYHSLNSLNILLFIYVPSHLLNNNNKYNNNYIYNNLLISRIINRLININNNNNISDINLLFKNIYNKNIIIEPIYIKYSYLNSIILSKTLQQQINIIHRFKGKYAQTINNRIPLININNIIHYNYKIKNMLNWILTINNNIYSNNYIYNSTNLNNSILPFMLHQYIIGYNWEYKGKIQQSESNARSIKHNERYGIFNSEDHILNNNTFKLLNKPVGLSSNSSWNTNKNGIYNIKVILSHI